MYGCKKIYPRGENKILNCCYFSCSNIYVICFYVTFRHIIGLHTFRYILVCCVKMFMSAPRSDLSPQLTMNMWWLKHVIFHYGCIICTNTTLAGIDPIWNLSVYTAFVQVHIGPATWQWTQLVWCKTETYLQHGFHLITSITQ